MPGKTLNDSQEFYSSYFSSEGEIAYNNQQRYNIVFSLVEKLDITRDARVLDVGSGAGRITKFLNKRFDDVVALDITTNPLIIEAYENGVMFSEGALPNLPFKNTSFDLVVCSEVLEHIPKRSAQFASVAELSRILKQDGWVVVSTPNPHSIYQIVKNTVLDMAEATPFYERGGGQIIENWIPPSQLSEAMAENFEIEVERGSYYSIPGFGSGLESLLRPVSDRITKRNIAPHHGLYQYYLGRKFSQW